MSATDPAFFEILKNAGTLLDKKREKPGNITPDQLFEAEIFLAQLQQVHEQNPKEHPSLLAKKLQKESKAAFDAAHAEAKAQAEKFAVVQGMSAKEKETHLTDVSNRLSEEIKKFEAQWDFNISLISFSTPPSVPQEKDPVDDEIEKTLAALRGFGYIAEAIDKLDILFCKNGISGRKPDKMLDKIPIDDKYDVVVNGTFFDGQKGPLGAIIIDGRFEHVPVHEKIGKRGAMAVMTDGSYRFAQTEDVTKEGVIANFQTPGKPNDKVKSLMAGGVLIIRNGKDIEGDDIFRAQQFDQPRADLQASGVKITSAWQSDQLRPAEHTLFAMRQGQLYLIVTTRPEKQAGKKQRDETGGQQIQTNLVKLGFDNAIIFDGGSRCYLRSKSKEIKNEKAGRKISDIPCGFGIKICKSHGKKQ